MKIAIDFDGTCVTHDFPKVGRSIGAEETLRDLVKNGHELILHTMRSYMSGISPVTDKREDGGLKAAIKWFKDNKIELWGINKNPDQYTWTTSPKPYAQLYIDDAALGCPLIYDQHPRPYADWTKIRKMLIKNKIL